MVAIFLGRCPKLSYCAPLGLHDFAYIEKSGNSKHDVPYDRYYALKGQNITAQGNALGKIVRLICKALKGRNKAGWFFGYQTFPAEGGWATVPVGGTLNRSGAELGGGCLTKELIFEHPQAALRCSFA
ncbi:MAG: hypothetical protein HZA50_16950 [Planctomycetes bacterium]|nr:hypothetical protein [Planctomycetota bacterium]